MKRIIITIPLFLVFLFLSCEFPDTQDNLDGELPAVWAVFSPDKPVYVYITKVVDFDTSISRDSSFVHNGELQLVWDSGQIDFVESVIDTYGFQRPVYVPQDTSFRVQPGTEYTLVGRTSVGDFSGTFTVPNRPSFEIYPNTSVFDNERQAAFAVSVDVDPTVYEYEIYFENIGESRDFLPDSIILMDCYDLRWPADIMPQTVGVPWCKFYYATRYRAIVQAQEKHFYKYLDYYYYYDDESDDSYLSPPGGDGYTGVIGAYCESVDTVEIVLGY